MKKTTFLSVLMLVLIITWSCNKTCTINYTYKMYTPVYKSWDDIRNGFSCTQPQPVRGVGNMVVVGNTLYLLEADKGIHIIDNSQTGQPQALSFLVVPGCRQLSVKGTTLYTDSYTDLLTIDASAPTHATLLKREKNVYPYHQYEGGFSDDPIRGAIVYWEQKDTTIKSDCSKSSSGPIVQTNKAGQLQSFMVQSNTSSTGTSSSYTKNEGPQAISSSFSRSATIGEYIYSLVDHQLYVFHQSAGLKTKINLNNPNVETIQAADGNLFMGSNTGMIIYDCSNPESPKQAGTFEHVQSKDPVVVEGKTAYVTTRRDNGSGFNEITVIDISNIYAPKQLAVQMLSSPYGLAVSKGYIYICDGSSGLRLYNYTSPYLKKIKDISKSAAFDIIYYNNNLLVKGEDGLYYYSVAQPDNPQFAGKLQFAK